MKKNYNAPNITIVNIKMETSLLQAASVTIKNQDANSAAMSRSNSSWDDEE